MLVIWVHPVMIMRALFCVACSACELVLDTVGNHAGEAQCVVVCMNCVC